MPPLARVPQPPYPAPPAATAGEWAARGPRRPARGPRAAWPGGAAAPILLGAAACLLAACGATAPQAPRPVPSATAPHHAARPLPLPPIPRAPVTFVIEGGAAWRAPLVPSAADAASFARLVALLRAARQTPPIPAMVFRPGTLTVLASPPAGSPSWVIGFPNGRSVNVAAEVVRCGTAGCPPAAGYATLDGVPARAPGLITALQAITSGLPVLQAITIRPSALPPGGSARVAGAGWIGPTVRLSLAWNGSGAVRPVPVATVPVHGGRFAWDGRLPTDLQAGPYQLDAADPVRAAQAAVTVR